MEEMIDDYEYYRYKLKKPVHPWREPCRECYYRYRHPLSKFWTCSYTGHGWVQSDVKPNCVNPIMGGWQ